MKAFQEIQRTLPQTIQEQRRPGVRSDFAFRNRGLFGAVILVPAGAAALFSAPSVPEYGNLGLSMNTAGWICFLLYAGIRIWATLFIGGNKERVLQTEGPYSLCRNPLYLGSFCSALAVALFLKSATFGVALLILAAFYSLFVVQAEERFLVLRFQEDFRNYCRRAPAFWPRWSGFHSPPMVNVELKRLRGEVKRLGRMTLLLVILQVILHWRTQPWWPHGFHVY